jgi:hypothetical protein
MGRNVRRDYWRAAGQGLKNGEVEALPEGRREHKAGRVVKGSKLVVGHATKPPHIVRDSLEGRVAAPHFPRRDQLQVGKLLSQGL